MQQYLDLLQHVKDNGEQHSDRTGTGTLSCFGAQARYSLNTGFPLLTTKKMWWRAIVVELLWFLSGSTDVADLQKQKVGIWDEWATAEQCERFGRKEGDLGPVYGHLWRHFGAIRGKTHGIDQIEKLVSGLVNNPGSRRHIVTGWDPATCDSVALPPCHTLFQFRVGQSQDASTNVLHCQLYQRSADLFLGVPFNMASYALLTHMLAHVCGYQPGDFIHTFGDVHIYKNHMSQVEQQLGRHPKSLPTISIDDKFKGGGFSALLKITPDDIAIENYDPYSAIKAPVSV